MAYIITSFFEEKPEIEIYLDTRNTSDPTWTENIGDAEEFDTYEAANNHLVNVLWKKNGIPLEDMKVEEFLGELD